MSDFIHFLSLTLTHIFCINYRNNVDCGIFNAFFSCRTYIYVLPFIIISKINKMWAIGYADDWCSNNMNNKFIDEFYVKSFSLQIEISKCRCVLFRYIVYRYITHDIAPPDWARYFFLYEIIMHILSLIYAHQNGEMSIWELVKCIGKMWRMSIENLVQWGHKVELFTDYFSGSFCIYACTSVYEITSIWIVSFCNFFIVITILAHIILPSLKHLHDVDA